MSQTLSQDSARCVVAYDQTKGTILAVHFLPSGGLPGGLTEVHFHEITRSHASTRSGLELESIAALTTNSAGFAVGTRLHVDPATRQLVKIESAGHAEFAEGAGSSGH